jgi:hypothetical protein
LEENDGNGNCNGNSNSNSNGNGNFATATATAIEDERNLKRRREGKPLFFLFDQADWNSLFRSGRQR